MHFRSIAVTLLSAAVLACSGKADSAAADSSAAPAAPATPVVAAVNGKEEYIVCQACHQENGAGVPGAFPPLAGSDWVTGDAKIPIAIILHGLQGEIEVNGTKYNGVMAAWGQLSDEQIAAILTYERSSWGNAASAVTAAEVAAVRAATAGRTTPWNGDEVKKAAL